MHTTIRFLTFVALAMSLVFPRTAEASGLWETWKMVRPQGPGYSFFVEIETADYPDGPGMNLYYAPLPGTGFTSAALPSDVGITLWFIVNGQSGRFAKDKDRKELVLYWRHAYSDHWQPLAGQYRREEERLPRDFRWGNVLTVSLPPSRIPFGTILFKVGTPHDQDPPMIFLNKVNKTLRQMIDEAAGMTQRRLPAYVGNGNHNRGNGHGNGKVTPNGVPPRGGPNGDLQEVPIPRRGNDDFDPDQADDAEFVPPARTPTQDRSNGYGRGGYVRPSRDERGETRLVKVIIEATPAQRRKYPLALRWEVNGRVLSQDIPIDPAQTSYTERVAEKDTVDLLFGSETSKYWWTPGERRQTVDGEECAVYRVRLKSCFATSR